MKRELMIEIDCNDSLCVGNDDDSPFCQFLESYGGAKYQRCFAFWIEGVPTELKQYVKIARRCPACLAAEKAAKTKARAEK